MFLKKPCIVCFELVHSFISLPLLTLCQSCGRIQNITSPTPVPAGTPRSSDILFHRVRSATIARNTIHGYTFSDGDGITRLKTVYQRPIQAHAIRDWLTSHPRIVLPIIFFLLGTLTYTVRELFSDLFMS